MSINIGFYAFSAPAGEMQPGLYRIGADGSPGHLGQVSDDGLAGPSIEEKLDRAIAGLCPCGAEPVEEFAPYCGSDCLPTHRGANTSSAPPWMPHATAARWRPELVTEDPDAGLTLLGESATDDRLSQVFLRADARTVHLRVDDGNRFVGANLPLDAWLGAGDDVAQCWEDLDRELGDPRRVAGGTTRGLAAGLQALTEAFANDPPGSLEELVQTVDDTLGPFGCGAMGTDEHLIYCLLSMQLGPVAARHLTRGPDQPS
jgi:hypothetical protein